MIYASLLPAVLSVCLVAAAPAAAPQEPPAASARTGKLTDGPTGTPTRVHGDAREFSAEVKDGMVHCTLKMAKPLIEGIFVCCELRIDCDNNPKTGDAGDELYVRGLVGSRFQPNGAAPTNGSTKPIEFARLSQSYRVLTVRNTWTWLMNDIDGTPPVVDGDTMRFSFVLARVREFGDRYKSTFTFDVRVTTSCSDQPLERVHSCADEGLAITLDGKDDEWSGILVADPGDELHPHLRCADLTGLRVDHSAERVFAAVTLAEAGFAAWRQDNDVQGAPVVTFHLEPMYPRYQDPVTREMRGGLATHGTANLPFHAVVGEKTIEASFARKTGQGRYRVLVRSDVELEDRFTSRMTLDAEAK